MNNLFSMFLSQSYADCWEDYRRSLKLTTFPHWDYIILTASNEHQAEGFRKQIQERKENLPAGTKFVVIPDKEGKRVGSGGATLSVLKHLYKLEGGFDKLRILVIHSGGDSKRVPQYSALGKLFSPVPHILPDGRASSLFDEFIICMSSMPSRIQEGMLLLSGDVLLLFNPLQIDYCNKGATAISFKENAQIGTNHGVFLKNENENVKCFLHKQTVDTLKSYGAINESGCVDIDTGAVIFSKELQEALYSLIATDEQYEKYVNDTVRLSLYSDFLYPLAEDSTLEQFYNEKPEGEFCDELLEARRNVWNVLHMFELKLLCLAPAKFIHFGTTYEIQKLMSDEIDEYKALDWNRQVGSSIANESCSGYNSVLSGQAVIGKDCYLESAYVHRQAMIGNSVVLSYIEVLDQVIPDNVVLHGLKQRNGKFVVRIYGIKDNPKENRIFGLNLEEIGQRLGVDFWNEGEERNLWNAKIYLEKENIYEALSASLKLHKCFTDRELKRENFVWKQEVRKSLCSGFNDADTDAIIAWGKRMQELVQMNEIANHIQGQVPVGKLCPIKPLTDIQKEWLKTHLSQVGFGEKLRWHYYLGVLLEDEKETLCCFEIIQKTILEEIVRDLNYNYDAKIVVERHTVRLPLRVNWGGGWSDTPPYCNENGGTVLNAAILLNGEKPVEVTLERISEKKIIFDSRDMDVHIEYDTIEPLQITGDPFDPFALQKACLLACGIIPKEGNSLKKILGQLGGGFVLRSEVHNIPKGSGLGTSSILSAACVKAVLEFMGVPYTNDSLYNYVLAMEQIMSTGGGWQDQVGGLRPGLKLISSTSGIKQTLKIRDIELTKETKEELEKRFVLISTGQRRLARNLLREVVGRYIGNDSESIFALNEIQRVAALMAFELERGNVDEFAKLLNYHWELSKKIDSGSSNTLIEQIFSSIDDLIDGKLVCGAGGGGFLQVILKKGIAKQEVRQRLKTVFQDTQVDVWECQIMWE